MQATRSFMNSTFTTAAKTEEKHSIIAKIFDHSKIDGRKSIPYSFVDRLLTEEECSSLVRLVDKMTNTLRAEKDGIGLALPQLGIFNGQLFIINLLPTDGQQTTETEAFFNPSYTYNPNSTTKESQIEGCLSVRKTTRQLFAIERPVSIQASWYQLDETTRTFTKREETLTGLRARVFMHEYDHLQGVSIVTKFNKQQQQQKTTSKRSV